MRKYQLTGQVATHLKQDVYERWLQRKAVTHIRRDRKRGNTTATTELYKIAIHKAVCESGGRDAYTNEELNWDLLSKYDNEKSRKGGSDYKKTFALLPSVDHVGDGTGEADFKICAWRTNDSKNDLSYLELVAFCKKVLSVYNKD